MKFKLELLLSIEVALSAVLLILAFDYYFKTSTLTGIGYILIGIGLFGLSLVNLHEYLEYMARHVDYYNDCYDDYYDECNDYDEYSDEYNEECDDL